MGRFWAGLSGLVTAGAIVVGGAAISNEVEAKTSFDSAYTLAQTYNASLRMIRVDLGLKILERDPEAAYLVFEYRSFESGARLVQGTLEMVDAGRLVKVVVQIPQMPRYHEQVLVDRLTRKLREEYGEPIRKTDRAPADAGTEAAAYE